MPADLLRSLAQYRFTIGYLGEREQFGWWQSAFFSTSSRAFLDPVFPRTRFVAQCHGVTLAAARVHDERIGVGRVYHLFRLPEEMEQGIHQVLHDPELAGLAQANLANKDAALQALRQLAVEQAQPGLGPTRIGPSLGPQKAPRVAWARPRASANGSSGRTCVWSSRSSNATSRRNSRWRICSATGRWR